MTDNNPAVVVVSDVLGQAGGAYRVTSLLCRALAQQGANVVCFATWVEKGWKCEQEPFRVILPWIQRGYRWDVPNRVLAAQAVDYIRRTKPIAVIVIGLTRICGHLLDTSVANQLLVWELTNADQGNKFVDTKAARLIHRALGVLSPAESIDVRIRETYGYHGTIHRLPFWIEDERRPYAAPPATHRSDFLFLARRDNEKGLRELLQAAAKLSGEYPNLRIQVGGPGDAQPFTQLAKELGISDSVEFCSLPSRMDAMAALASTRYLVLPSYHEGYPLSLLEATQYSIPFIATEVGSIGEIFADCGACRMIPSRNIPALYDAMKSCLSESLEDYVSRRKAAHRKFHELSSATSVATTLRSTFLNASAHTTRVKQETANP
jgi:glycosyltransferase involved in cell wall biosynthesis